MIKWLNPGYSIGRDGGRLTDSFISAVSSGARRITEGSNAQIVTFAKSGDSEGATSHDGRVAKVVEN
ncbi:hypothetical protein TW80_17265 [Loktanella sp. S4079]|nr:hypothetical protein TW80_17265 [Loktanella sp. S4079]